MKTFEIITVSAQDAHVDFRHDVYKTAADKLDKLSEILSKKLGRKVLVRKRTNHKHVNMFGEVDYLVKEIIYKAQGFSAQEYEQITQQACPNQDWGPLIAEESGKVKVFSERGNLSMNKSGSAFVSKGSLITKLLQDTNIIVAIV